MSNHSDTEKDDLSTTPFLYTSNESLPHPRLSPWRDPRLLVTVIASLLLTNILTFTLTHYSATEPQPSVSEPPKGVPRIFSSLPRITVPRLLNSTLYSYNNVYRNHSSLETDTAWRNLAPADGVFLVQKGDEAQSDIDPDRHVYWDKPEQGLVGYPVASEAIHGLHCLNMLRRHLFFNAEHTIEHYTEQERIVTEKYRILHIDHCVDMLRQRLMCTADLGIVPHFWLKSGDTAPDFVRMHTCRDYEAIREFMVENAHAMPKDGEIVPKKGDFVLEDYI